MTDVPKILIVDDEQSICYVLKVNLELEGFSVDTAFSAEEALAKRLERYDLFLLDVMMEHMSGFDLAKVIRGREELNAIPIIFCTAKDSEDDLLEGFNNGADDYIRKPFSMRELVARVKSVLHRSGRYSNEKEVLKFQTLTLRTPQKECFVVAFGNPQQSVERRCVRGRSHGRCECCAIAQKNRQIWKQNFHQTRIWLWLQNQRLVCTRAFSC